MHTIKGEISERNRSRIGSSPVNDPKCDRHPGVFGVFVIPARHPGVLFAGAA